jgi:hypothetical protein
MTSYPPYIPGKNSPSINNIGSVRVFQRGFPPGEPSLFFRRKPLRSMSFQGKENMVKILATAVADMTSYNMDPRHKFGPSLQGGTSFCYWSDQTGN